RACAVPLAARRRKSRAAAASWGARAFPTVPWRLACCDLCYPGLADFRSVRMPGATAPERRDATSSTTTDRLLRKDVRLRCVGTTGDDHSDALNMTSLGSIRTLTIALTGLSPASSSSWFDR